jgi:hypothetical protein
MLECPIGWSQTDMARVIPVLFILGAVWAPFAWAGVVYLFADGRWNGRHLLSLNALVGYGVWFGWGWHCLTGRFPLASVRQFWSISLATHLVWLAVILLDARSFGPRVSYFALWIVANVIVAFLALLPASWSTRLPEGIVPASCYGLAIFLALGAAWSVNHIPGLSVFLIVVAAIAFFVLARRESQQADDLAAPRQGQ